MVPYLTHLLLLLLLPCDVFYSWYVLSRSKCFSLYRTFTVHFSNTLINLSFMCNFKEEKTEDFFVCFFVNQIDDLVYLHLQLLWVLHFFGSSVFKYKQNFDIFITCSLSLTSICFKDNEEQIHCWQQIFIAFLILSFFCVYILYNPTFYSTKIFN